MELIGPTGVRFRVSDERGEQFLAQGYRRSEAVVETTAPAPEVPATPKPARRRKTNTDK